MTGRAPHWPPGVFPPALFWGTLNTIVLLASAAPNQLAKKAPERLDLRRTQLWLVVAIMFAVAFNVIRIFEFRSLNVWWDTNAYGSAVWTLLGLHTTHILTDLLDTLVLTVLMFTGPIDQTRFVDVSDNAFYWYFVVLSWLPIYGLIYLVVFLLHAAALWIWHIPRLYEAALRNEAVHALEHVSFLVTAALFWWA